MIFLLLKTLEIGLIGFFGFLAFYILMIFIMNLTQIKKEKSRLLNFHNK